LGPHVEALLYQSIIDGALLVEPIIAVDWQRIRELVVQYADLRLGGTDASVIALAERLHVDRIATLNDRDFTVVRPNHTGALTLVP
jgi:predicted nucleic acid-binding protein